MEEISYTMKHKHQLHDRCLRTLNKKGWNLNDTEAVVCRLAISSENNIWNYHSKKIIWSEMYSWSCSKLIAPHIYIFKMIVRYHVEVTSYRHPPVDVKCTWLNVRRLNHLIRILLRSGLITSVFLKWVWLEIQISCTYLLLYSPMICVYWWNIHHWNIKCSFHRHKNINQIIL